MRIRSLFLFSLSFTAALALPPPKSGVAPRRVDPEAVPAERDMSIGVHVENRDGHKLAVVYSIRSATDGGSLSARGVGDLGKDAFAGSGAPAKSITALQHLLHAHGHNVGVDGQWGPETSGAVSAFQKAADLAADGIPGPATLGALVSQIQQGAKGDVVKAAQVLLNVAVDGDFGPATHTAAVAFQEARGLDQDGIIGKATWTALFTPGGAPPPAPPPAPTPGGDIPAGLPPPAAVRSGDAYLLDKAYIDRLAPAARYAAAAYCAPEKWKKWECKHCTSAAAPSKKLYASGGGPQVGGGILDWQHIPHWYMIGNGETVAIAIEGSDGITFANNANIGRETPSKKYFPGITSDAKVHKGWHWAFTEMIEPILKVLDTATKENQGRILVVGHSQGGAIAQVLAVALKLRVKAPISLRTFGQPRVGSPKWADYVDTHLSAASRRIINKADPVPHAPPKSDFYKHSGGEVWRTKDSQYILCKGQDNAKCAASFGLSDLVFEDHMGPYPGNVQMGC